MFRPTLISILWVILASVAFSEYELEKEEGAVSRLINNERSLLAVSVIATISAIASGVVSVQKLATLDIDDDGAQFNIENWFKDIEAHHKGTHIEEGKDQPLKPPAALIKAGTKDNSGGAFDDDGAGGVGSAGYVQYEITDPISQQDYCYGYLWASEADKVFCKTNGGNWIVAVIRQGSCGSVDDGFKDLRSKLGTAIAPHCSDINDCDAQIDATSYSSDATYRSVHILRALGKEIRVSSIDAKIGMTLAVSVDDGDEDHPSIKIYIGPYKQIFGKATSGNYAIFHQTSEICFAPGGLGMFFSATECHKSCVSMKGGDCKYFEYDIRYWWCKWISDPKDSNCNIIFNHMSHSDDYELLENNQHCVEAKRELIGTFETTDECWNKCRTDQGDSCTWFSFGVAGTDYGKCYLEKECGPGRYVKNEKYNLYGALK